MAVNRARCCGWASSVRSKGAQPELTKAYKQYTLSDLDTQSDQEATGSEHCKVLRGTLNCSSNDHDEATGDDGDLATKAISDEGAVVDQLAR